MDMRKIRELVKIMESSTLTELTYKEDEMEISLSKNIGVQVVAQAAPQPAAVQPVQEAAAEEEDESLLVTAPIVGTFYSAPAPDAPAYVKVGDHVKKGQTVCILEAMKLMNEIEVEYDCEIEAVLVSNEQKVEYGQPLFRVQKL